MLVLIPVIHEYNWYVNCLCPYFPFTQWTVTYSYGTTAVVLQILLDNDRLMCGRRFHVSTNTFTSSCAKFHAQTSGCTERFKQLHRHYFILDSNQNLLNIRLYFSFNNLTLLRIHSFAVVQILNKPHELEFFRSGEKCESASDKLHAAQYNLTATWV